MRSGLRHSHPEEGEDSPRRATERRGGFGVRGSGRGLSAVGTLRVAGAERSEAPVFGSSDQPWRRPDAIGTPSQPSGSRRRFTAEGPRERNRVQGSRGSSLSRTPNPDPCSPCSCSAVSGQPEACPDASSSATGAPAVSDSGEISAGAESSRSRSYRDRVLGRASPRSSAALTARRASSSAWSR